jgi:hypothetical protein
MQEKQTVLLAKVAALLIAVPAIYFLATTLQVWPDLVSAYVTGSLDPTKRLHLFMVTSFVFMDLFLIAKLVVAYGLFSVRRWSRRAAILIVSFDLMLYFVALIGVILCLLVFRTPLRVTSAPYAFEMASQIPWTQNVSALIDVASLLVLIQPSVRMQFERSPPQAGSPSGGGTTPL